VQLIHDGMVKYDSVSRNDTASKAHRFLAPLPVVGWLDFVAKRG
jgi:hypothetical protein